jgi:hypothetical protein
MDRISGYQVLFSRHSTNAGGVLLAHILAITATAKGNADDKWLAAASLDRYICSVAFDHDY